jgi:hypothetical protein
MKDIQNTNFNFNRHLHNNSIEEFDEHQSFEYDDSLMIESGHVYIVSTPIGNLGDISIRAKMILSHADIICAEDTRRTKSLLKLLNISYKDKVLAHHEHNYKETIPKLIHSITHNKSSIAIVSDAGTPCISDPGYQFISVCHENNIPVHPIPGPSAVTAALTVSGFPSSMFTFLGKRRMPVMLAVLNAFYHPRSRESYKNSSSNPSN